MKKIILIVLGLMLTVGARAQHKSEDVLKELSEEVPQFDFYAFAGELESSGGAFDTAGILKKAGGIFEDRLKESARETAVILIPIILFGIFSAFNRADENGAVKGAFFGCFALVLTHLTAVFSKAAALAEDTAATVDIIHKSLVPALFTLLSAGGEITRTIVLRPFVTAASQIIMQIMRGIILPLVLYAFALILTESITGFDGLKRFGKLILSLSEKALVFMIVLFLAILSAQSLMAGSIDSVALKSGKFAVSNFIPVVGRAVSDGIETLSASMRIIRNSMGISGAVGVAAITFYPVVKIYACSLVFHITAALCFPVSDKRFGEIFSAAGDTMGLLGSLVLSMSFVFIVTAAIILAGPSPR